MGILSQEKHIVYALTMCATTATSTEYFTKNIDMSHYHDVTFVMLYGAGTAAGTVYVERVPIRPAHRLPAPSLTAGPTGRCPLVQPRIALAAETHSAT